MASISCCMLIFPKNKVNSLTSFIRKSVSKPSLISCNAASSNLNCDQTAVTRRSANYQPPVWDFNFIQSLDSKYSENRYLVRASELKVQVKAMLEEAMDTVYQLELIDELQKMGISYHFKEEIKKILTSIYQKEYVKNEEAKERDLYSTALGFRLLRQHGFSISQDIFDCYKNVNNGDFKSSLCDDTKGLLQLYEASYMLIEGEKTLELAREFATICLKKNLEEVHTSDQNLTLLVGRALELPLHWRIERPNARWFIDAYERREDMNPVLLEFAKLDFNILQATHQQELKHVSRWWTSTGLAEKLPFARDRLVEFYCWSLGLLSEPSYGYSRIMVTKVIAFITLIDDIFDVYGTLEELQLFNNTIQRWDIGELDQLPQYMQICYLALEYCINEMAYDVLKEQGIVIIPYIRILWKDLCRTFLQEANWYSTGYTPTMEEYINNAWISISGPIVLCNTFFLVTNPINKEAIQSLYKYHDIVRWSGMIFRLTNDLGTSSDEIKRGDVPKSIQCYMNETNCSIEEAQEHVKLLIQKSWENMNKELVASSPFSHIFTKSAVDVGRMAHYMYQHGDGHGSQDVWIKERISKLLFQPIE